MLITTNRICDYSIRLTIEMNSFVSIIRDWRELMNHLCTRLKYFTDLLGNVIKVVNEVDLAMPSPFFGVDILSKKKGKDHLYFSNQQFEIVVL